jgi:hypothetical protein
MVYHPVSSLLVQMRAPLIAKFAEALSKAAEFSGMCTAYRDLTDLAGIS